MAKILSLCMKCASQSWGYCLEKLLNPFSYTFLLPRKLKYGIKIKMTIIIVKSNYLRVPTKLKINKKSKLTSILAIDFLSKVKDCCHIPVKVFVQNSCSEKLQLAYNLLKNERCVFFSDTAFIGEKKYYLRFPSSKNLERIVSTNRSCVFVVCTVLAGKLLNWAEGIETVVDVSCGITFNSLKRVNYSLQLCLVNKFENHKTMNTKYELSSSAKHTKDNHLNSYSRMNNMLYILNKNDITLNFISETGNLKVVSNILFVSKHTIWCENKTYLRIPKVYSNNCLKRIVKQSPTLNSEYVYRTNDKPIIIADVHKT
ncbi:hypothetical protein AGLY_009680 [Aphis glycines]|uniref:Uncharacterized protein n=1 Tax=Aphis glycines TaxID=307491 RepID=A0A6G0TH53_APHGL|nr:hypothetical protein AGLY_009680 [Aphis glycines]